MTLRVKILAGGMLLFASQFAWHQPQDSGDAPLAFSTLFFGRAEAMTPRSHDVKPHHGQEIVFASSRVVLPKVFYGSVLGNMVQGMLPPPQPTAAPGGVPEPVIPEKSLVPGQVPPPQAEAKHLSAPVSAPIVPHEQVATLLAAPVVSPREIGTVVECVSQAVAGEARGEIDTGQVGVANVIVNRMKAWGGSYCSRVYDKKFGVCQFDGACHHFANYTHEVAGRARTVALAAVTGHLHDVTGGALYFHVCRKGSERDPSFTVRIQNHCYFNDLPGLTLRDVLKRREKAAERLGVKTIRNPPVIHVDYTIIPDKNGKYGFRLSEARRT